MNLSESKGEWKLEAHVGREYVINKTSRLVINGHGRCPCSATKDRAPLVPQDLLTGNCVSSQANLRRADVEMEGRMSGAGYVTVNGFDQKPRTASVVKIPKVEVRAGLIDPLGSGRTPPKRNLATLQAAARPKRPAAPKRGQVKAAIAQSVIQTLSSIVQGARNVALRRSFSWHS
ncbi:hypothetical protein KC19_VG221300 [Ceratodon purpureus]|uniref:Uncharacterized protein n=1 Tax=Ceratodon purpureus TaxID=3225 RepID=A0A8T0HSV3_CERPU|nr:hypothetical protein KC19_VG221300 [Ceratodon purpureus]